MVNSMTGYASKTGAGAGASWVWELRSVNARGLDLRLRLPDWIEGLEPAVRARLSKAAARGNLSLSLRVARDPSEAALALDEDALARVLVALAEVEAAASHRGLTLAPSQASDILALRGVLDAGPSTEDTTALKAALLEDFEHLIAAFNDTRATEGQALEGVIARQVDAIDALITAAREATASGAEKAETQLRDALQRVVDTVDVDDARIAQELALLAVKADITEELDRLTAHVAAARGLLTTDAPAGRKLDFLAQEFNREANTLCAKSQTVALTSIGLDLKATIDQMREQVQNVE